jgi:hypothetical protein
VSVQVRIVIVRVSSRHLVVTIRKVNTMDNDKAIAASAAMVAIAAVASGAFFFSAQAGTTDPAIPGVPAPAVVVEYIDANGNLIPVETTSEPIPVVAAAPVAAATAQEYEAGEYDDEHEEHEDDEDDDNEEQDDD